MRNLIKLSIRFLLNIIRFFIFIFIYFFLFFNFKKKFSKEYFNFKSINLVTFGKYNGLSYVMDDLGDTLKRYKFKLNYVYIVLPLPFFKRMLSRLRSKIFKNNSINIFIGNPNIIPASIFLDKNAIFANHYNVGLWFWELYELPWVWKSTKKFINEIWVYSEFNANIFKSLNLNIHKIPFAIDIKINRAYDRPYFHLPLKPFIFLFSFDFGSSFNRKNPLAVIKAFTNAFRRSKNVLLIIKSVNMEYYPFHKSELIQLINQANNIISIDKIMRKEEKDALINCCDCYVSLHRSEGLGLGMAEAMYLGKPVIATNFSGNLEFMNSSNSCLVNYKLKEVSADEYPHGFSLRKRFWADPDINHASELMLKIRMNKSFRDKIGIQASHDIKLNFSKETQGASILSRLRAISNYQ
jgi:glycosyltransferase involved in cell wall biosynthesis